MSNQTSKQDQYTTWQILGIWAGAALPMGLSYWVVMPVLHSRESVNPFMYLFLTTLGLVWQGVLAFIILKQEVKPFTWQGLKDRLWLYTPSDPQTRILSKRLFLWTIPLIILMQAYYGIGVMGWLNELFMKTFPFLIPPSYTSIRSLAGPAVGQWWLLGILAVMIVFNYLLGEELIFRGILLPKMNGMFGKWDWLANHLLFVTYHLHKVSDWPAFLLIDWITPWAAKRFKSYWVAVILHGVEAVMLVVMFPLAIMGLV
ncbi:MAG TPA: CPBP family intramembrane glutamic endopeptidase [Anaerolineales bacterium]